MELTTETRLVDALAQWQGHPVAVRVVTSTEDLVAVFAGELKPRSTEAHPPLFWPVEVGEIDLATVERRGIYVHPELLSEVHLHEGGFVIEYVQAGVTVNLRRLD